MKRMTSKLLPLLLTMAMLLSMVPMAYAEEPAELDTDDSVPVEEAAPSEQSEDETSEGETTGDGKVVAKIGDTEYATLAEAIKNAESGDTVTLLADVTLADEYITIGNSLTLDGANHTITGYGTRTGGTTGNTYYNTILVQPENGTSNIAVTLKNLKVASGASTESPNYTRVVETRTAAMTLNLEDCTITANGSGDVKALVISGDSNVTGRNVTITNSTLTANEQSSQGAVALLAPASVTISGGELKGECNVYFYAGSNGSTLTVKDGSTLTSGEMGTFGCGAENVAITVEGGTFTTSGNKLLTNDAGGSGTLAITGGTFSVDPTAYVDTSKYDVTESDGTYTVAAKTAAPVAEVNGTQYTTLKDAISAAKDGDTVTLLTDVNTPETTYVLSKSVTIDLSSKTVQGSGYDGVFQITGKDARVVIKNGKIIAHEASGSDGKYTMAIWACAEGCEVTLDNLNVSQKITSTDDKQMDMIYTSAGTIIINSGTFESGTPAWTLNCNDAAYKAGTAKILVNGGTFAGFDPRNNAAEGKGTSFVNSGVGVTDNNNGTFSAQSGMVAQVLDANGSSVKAYDKLADAIDAAEDGQTVKLLADTTEDVTVKSAQKLTLDLNGKKLMNETGHTITVNKNAELTIEGTGTVDNVTNTKAAVYNMGTVTLNGGNYTRSEENGINSSDNGGNSYYTVLNHGDMTINDTVVISQTGSYSSLVENGYQDYNKTRDGIDNPHMLIAGGTLDGGLNAVKNDEGGILKITGGEVKNSNNSCVLNWNEAEISGGTFDLTSGKAVVRVGYDSKNAVGKITITGGKFTAPADTPVIADCSGSAGSIDVAVSGGTFSSKVPADYCAEGFIPKANKDGTYGVEESKPFEVWTGLGGTGFPNPPYTGTKVAAYKTLAEAVAKLDGNPYIVIASDYTLTEDFTIPDDVYLDVATGATLTIADGVKLTVAANCGRLGVRSGATVVNNGTILVCGTNYSKGKVTLFGDDTLAKSLTVPEGYMLAKNRTNYYAALANFTITYADGSSKNVDAFADNLDGAVRVTLLHDLDNFAGSISGVADGFVFDLGGHTLTGKTTATTYMLTLSAPATLTNGTICYVSGDAEHGALWVQKDVVLDSSLTVDGGAGYGAYLDGYGITLTVNGTVKTDGSCAITGNGSNQSSTGTTIDVTDCSVIVNDGANISAPGGIGIYHSPKGTVTVNGGKISGHTGIQMCAGKLIVNGGEITSTGANVDHTGSTNVMPDGAAISIVNRNYPGGIPSLEITGGTVKATGEGALAVKVYDYSNDKVAEWTDAGTYVNISGGTFSNEIPDDYCVLGYQSKANDDGTTHTVAAVDGNAAYYDANGKLLGYANVEEALKKSEAKTVKLIKDVKDTAVNVILHSGVVLDLNGHTLTAEFVYAPLNGEAGIIDSAVKGDGAGELLVKDMKTSMSCTAGYMPIYAGQQDDLYCYRFYTVRYAPVANEGTGDTVNVRFWFIFDNKQAYMDILTNPDQFKVQLDTDLGSVEGGARQTLYFEFKKDMIFTWAKENYAGFDNKTGAYFRVTLKGLDGVEEKAIVGTPFAESKYTMAKYCGDAITIK